jgi:hypothetical protein
MLSVFDRLVFSIGIVACTVMRREDTLTVVLEPLANLVNGNIGEKVVNPGPPVLLIKGGARHQPNMIRISDRPLAALAGRLITVRSLEIYVQ